MAVEVTRTQKGAYVFQKRIYHRMVNFLHDEGRRKESLLVMKDSLKIQLEGVMLNKPFEADACIAGVSDCSYCSNFNLECFDPEIGFEKFGFDVMKCNREGNCLILLTASPRRDENGDIYFIA
jgi:hypothetical protein